MGFRNITMNVVYHCTDNYAFITGTSIVSLFENCKDIDEINVYIIENGFSTETKNKYLDLAAKYGRKMFFIPMPDVNSKYQLGLTSIKKKWLFDSYSRLFLDTILPPMDRVLYLDGDTLVLHSLKELWEMDLEDNCCAAALDCLGEPYYDLFDLSNGKYCNSGDILIDLLKWKEQHIADNVTSYVQQNKGYVFFMEQSVFNYVLQGKISYLSAKYNTSSIMQMFTPKQLWKMRMPKYFYSESEICEAVKDPYIIHMTGLFYVINKPWNEVTNHPNKDLFWLYFEKLNWGKDELQKDTRTFKTKFMDFIFHATPKFILVPVIGMVYNGPRVKKIKKQAEKMRSTL